MQQRSARGARAAQDPGPAAGGEPFGGSRGPATAHAAAALGAGSPTRPASANGAWPAGGNTPTPAARRAVHHVHPWLGSLIVRALARPPVPGTAAAAYDPRDRPTLPAAPQPTAVTADAAPPLVLIVDDEPELRALLADYLPRHGFAVLPAADAAEARRLLDSARPALAVLDVHMPGENGLALARWLRDARPGLGIVMLTTAAEPIDRVLGLEMGADDYVPKPFELRELVARLRAVARRLLPPASGAGGTAAPVGMPGVPTGRTAGAPGAGATPADAPAAPVVAPTDPGRRVPFGACWLHLDERRLLDAQGQELPLTAAEFDLLALFARHPNRPLSRDHIMEHAHHRGWDVFDRSIDLRVMRLRRKIEHNPDKPAVIKTVRNVGYVYVPPGGHG